MDSLRHWPLPMIRFHRALLIVATVGVAVAASRVAADTSEVGGWLLTSGFALLLLVADLAREVEEAAQALSGSSGETRDDARRDIYTTRHPRSILTTLLLALVLFVGSAVTYAMTHDGGLRQDPADRQSEPQSASHGTSLSSNGFLMGRTEYCANRNDLELVAGELTL
jgi:hypothetical protein